MTVLINVDTGQQVEGVALDQDVIRPPA